MHNSARDALMRIMLENDSLVVVGETGSGKTTRKLKFLDLCGALVICSSSARFPECVHKCK